MKRWILTFLCLALPLTLSATTVVPMDVEHLTKASTHVVEARAISSVSQWNGDHTLIFTYTNFSATRTLKGQVPATFMVRQLGGTVDGITQKVSGVRHWRPGEEAVLFLRPSTLPDGALVVTSLMQGNFLVQRTAEGKRFVSNGLPDAAEYHAATGQTITYRGSRLQLQDLESRVQRAVQK